MFRCFEFSINRGQTDYLTQNGCGREFKPFANTGLQLALVGDNKFRVLYDEQLKGAAVQFVQSLGLNPATGTEIQVNVQYSQPQAPTQSVPSNFLGQFTGGSSLLTGAFGGLTSLVGLNSTSSPEAQQERVGQLAASMALGPMAMLMPKEVVRQVGQGVMQGISGSFGQTFAGPQMPMQPPPHPLAQAASLLGITVEQMQSKVDEIRRANPSVHEITFEGPGGVKVKCDFKNVPPLQKTGFTHPAKQTLSPRKGTRSIAFWGSPAPRGPEPL